MGSWPSAGGRGIVQQRKPNDGAKQPLYVIDFAKLCMLGTFPAFRKMMNGDTDELFCDLESVDRQSSLIVYVSYPSEENYDFSDQSTCDLFYQNCVEGISSIKSSMIDGPCSCYVFISVSCVDRDASTYMKCHDVKAVMAYCDVIFTPITNIAGTTEPVADDEPSYFPQCTLAGWVDKSCGYLSSAWSRLEMFYGRNTPLDDPHKNFKYIGDLAQSPHGVRRHFVHFSCHTNPDEVVPLPTLLPLLENSLFDRYFPLEGRKSCPVQNDEITRLLTALLPLMKFTEPKYDTFGRRSGHGRWVLDCGSVYEGRCLRNTPNGFGRITHVDSGIVFEGAWERGVKSGHGKCTFPNQDVLHGYWRMGRVQGHGVMQYANGDKYTGDFEDDVAHGRGVMVYADRKCKYNGQWERGKENGTGSVEYENGDEFVGIFVDGRRQGKGVFTYAEGHEYDGEWLDDREHGRGVLEYEDSRERYDGEWVEGQEHGMGVYTDEEGNVYEGEFVRGKLTGKGSMRYVNGDLYSGMWSNGKPHGEGIMVYDNADVYTGHWVQGKRQGMGVLKYANGCKYQGSFAGGLQDGEGTYRWAGGDVYVGDWKGGMEDGYGTLNMSNGDVYEGKRQLFALDMVRVSCGHS